MSLRDKSYWKGVEWTQHLLLSQKTSDYESGWQNGNAVSGGKTSGKADNEEKK